ncbi:MAG: hypothetical protein JWN94_3680 [Betaproteobacteria bacterium]|nr:hypothetical protein [Betaproteobacteria bacterium]
MLNPIWFVLSFIVFWLVICGLLAFAGGWRELAARFKSDSPLEGEQFRFEWIAVGSGLFPVAYRNCVFATVGPQAFSISLLWLFRFLHPRLVIPWSAVERCEPTKLWFVKCIAVQVAGTSRRLLFVSRLGSKMQEMWMQSHGSSSMIV